MFKLIVASFFIAAVVAGPAEFQARILRSDSDINPDGSYQYLYETENGIAAQEQGRLLAQGPEGSISATGSYSYTAPDGTPVQIQYLADANGFQPAGNVIPTPPPIPIAILRSLEWNAAHPEQEAYEQRRY